MPTPRSIAAAALAAALCLAAPLAAYIVILEDGTRIVARDPIEIEGDTAIIVLQNGTRTSIAASEIDLDATREANRNDYGSAVVVDEGRVTELPTTGSAPRRETLSEVLGRRQSPALDRGSSTERPPGDLEPPPGAGAYSDYRMLPRRPFDNLEVAGEVQRMLRAQGVEEVLLFQGSRPRHLMLDVTANSEASVFRALEATSETLLVVRERFPGELDAFELVLATADRDPAGQFLLDSAAARSLAEEQVEVSAFFVDRVRF